ncbi:hypothetical protein E2C01_010972 [Portunus trituberculatus]|uniref:Uncharacterized protein n=1 Tax=Portunus trituberculatus TaxID=210409 RepID=A0A5B7DA23_PORTR|nr:hypothetical protein [Portunus trituberculatus]
MYRRVQVQRAPKLGHKEDWPQEALQPRKDMPSSAPSQMRGDGKAWVWRARLGARSFTDKRRKSFFINGTLYHCYGGWQDTELVMLWFTRLLTSIKDYQMSPEQCHQ